MARQARAARPRKGDAERILDTALELAATEGWRRLTLARIAAAAKVSLAELYSHYPSRRALLAAFFAHVDASMVAGASTPGEGEPEEASARDRLFDLIMRRLDALDTHKAAVASILRDARSDPVVLCDSCGPFRRSLRWMLECAGLSPSGLSGVIATKGLAVIYANTLRVWLRDDSDDKGRTMATLDRQLRGAETLVRMASSWCGRGRQAHPAT